MASIYFEVGTAPKKSWSIKRVVDSDIYVLAVYLSPTDFPSKSCFQFKNEQTIGEPFSPIHFKTKRGARKLARAIFNSEERKQFFYIQA